MSHFPPPLVFPSRIGLPVLLSVPHAGRDYDRATLERSTQGLTALETLEDPLVDRLAWRAIAAGFGAIIQQVPRALIDCNRSEEEVDPSAIRDISAMPVGPRAGRGLGIVPSRTHKHGKLWRQPIARQEFLDRLDQIHRPYHRAIADGLDRMAITFGQAILIDCHSMPARSRGQPVVIIGDRHGTSAAPWTTAHAAAIVRAEGYSAAINDPYAGGYITEYHGRPNDGIHAIQVEIDRSAYMDADRRSAGPAFDQVAQLLLQLATGLGEEALARENRVAAE